MTTRRKSECLYHLSFFHGIVKTIGSLQREEEETPGKRKGAEEEANLQTVKKKQLFSLVRKRLFLVFKKSKCGHVINVQEVNRRRCSKSESAADNSHSLWRFRHNLVSSTHGDSELNARTETDIAANIRILEIQHAKWTPRKSILFSGRGTHSKVQ